MHLRCAGILLAQCTDTWSYHLHNESGLTTHTDITQPHPSNPGPSLYPLSTYTIHTTATQTQTHVQHSPVPTGLVKPKPNAHIHSLIPSTSTPHRAKHIYITHTPPTPLIPRFTLIPSTSAVLDTIHEPRAPPTCVPALTTTTGHPCPTPESPSPSHPLTLSAYKHFFKGGSL